MLAYIRLVLGVFPEIFQSTGRKPPRIGLVAVWLHERISDFLHEYHDHLHCPLVTFLPGHTRANPLEASMMAGLLCIYLER